MTPVDNTTSGRDATPSAEQVRAFDDLPRDEAVTRLLRCLGVTRWADEVADARPYAAWRPLRDTAAVAAGHLDDDELTEALAGHPRIGERAGAGHDTAHSASEQSGVDPADAGVAARLAAGNTAYEARFDRVFLVRAKGRDATQILAELTRRLAHDDAAERIETLTALRDIALLRLEASLEETLP